MARLVSHDSPADVCVESDPRSGGLKDALDKEARMWNNGMKSQDMGGAMAGVEGCLLVFGQTQRKHERGCRKQHRSHFVQSFCKLHLNWKSFREQVVANSTPVVKRRR